MPAQNKSATERARPTVAQRKPATVTERPTAPQRKPAPVTERPTAAQRNSATVTERPAVAQRKPVTVKEQPAVAQNKPATERQSSVEKSSSTATPTKKEKASAEDKWLDDRTVVKITAIVLACVLAAVGLGFGLYYLVLAILPTRTTKFKEYVGTVNNPGMGYTRTHTLMGIPGKTKVSDVAGDLVLLFVHLGSFSAGSNAEGVDYDLDETFFASLRGTFENCRNNGSTIALRFRYDHDGKDNPEPKSFDQVLRHIEQIKNSGVLHDYADILMFVESGFVGKWGEQHGGKYTSLEYKARLLAAMLDCVPSPVPVTVRTPDIFAKYVGIERKDLADYVCKEGTEEYRVGLYNDGYMGSNSDLGTYADRAKETTWLSRQAQRSYFGGEFSGNIEFAKKYDTYLPQNAIPEMYKTHLSYINGNIFKLYKDYKYTKKYAIKGIDTSAYYKRSVFDFIRDHLGYRFVLKRSKLPKKVKPGGTLEFSFKLQNTGFANPVRAMHSEVVLSCGEEFVRIPVEIDPTQWRSASTVNEKVSVQLPADLAPGNWDVHLKFYYGNNTPEQMAMRSVRFANVGVYNETLGANRIGYITVKS